MMRQGRCGDADPLLQAADGKPAVARRTNAVEPQPGRVAQRLELLGCLFSFIEIR